MTQQIFYDEFMTINIYFVTNPWRIITEEKVIYSSHRITIKLLKVKTYTEKTVFVCVTIRF